MEYRRHPELNVVYMLLAVPTYLMVVPLLFLDVCMEVYQRSAFPVLRLPLVERRNYISLDRRKLRYLDWLDKLDCAYCGYANGVARMAVEIAARSEKYWCGIKHASKPGFVSPAHHQDFLEYGDEKQFQEFVSKK